MLGMCLGMRAVEVTLQTDDAGAQTLESPNPSIADGGFPLQVRRSPAFCDDCDSLEASAVFCSGNHKAICPRLHLEAKQLRLQSTRVPTRVFHSETIPSCISPYARRPGFEHDQSWWLL
jgi:hypothetical protein